MKANELMAFLKTVPPDSEVIMAEDEEGNRFKRIWEADFTLADDFGGGDWEFFDDDSDGAESALQTVVLWPKAIR